MKKHEVAIVDDHTLLSEAIADVVNRFENFAVIYSCKNGEELIHNLNTQRKKPDIVLMDVNMPIMNGVETTQWLSQHYSDIKVLALTVEAEENTILKMIRAGAKGYLLKDVDKKTLELALDKTMREGHFYTDNVTDVLVNSVVGRGQEEITLKEPEIEFLKLLCTELTYKEIADAMRLSPKTIDGYRDSLFTKLRAKNRIGLVLYAIKHKICEL